MSTPEYQRNDTFHMDRTKTEGTVQYFTLKYNGGQNVQACLPEAILFLLLSV